MGLFDHLVLAVDFSDASKAAVQAAVRLAKRTQAQKLTVLHSVKRVVLPSGRQPDVKKRLEDLKARINEAAHTQLNQTITELLDVEGLTIERKLVEGTPSRVCSSEAQAIGGTLLLLGTHSRTGLGRMFRGSVAESIVRTSPLPCFVMPVGKDQRAPAEEIEALGHITVAVDLHDGAAQVLACAKELAASFSAKQAVNVDALNVVSRPGLHLGEDILLDYEQIVQVEAQAELEEVVNGIGGNSIGVNTVVGDVEDEILNFAASKASQLIVIGTHGRGGAHRLELGSSALEVMRRSNVSTLVVPTRPDPER